MKRVLLIIPVLLVSGFIFFQINSQPVSSDSSIKNFVIVQGDGVNSISTRLQSNGLIRNKYIFLVLSHQLRKNNNLQAGLFKLSPSMSTGEVIDKLSSPGNNDYWLKILEGQRISEITPKFDKSLEGYLFPDSYLIPQDYTTQNIADLINKNFTTKFNQAKVGATNTKMSNAQIVTLASLLEREARTLNSRQQVAGILLNRLSIGMALQLDATVQYAKGSWNPVSKSDLSINSLYNTYKYPGLPPGPICNPGYDSLYAAFHPIDSDYMYYISDNSGVMHYAKSLADHNANVTKYLK
jgi:UPF0755 protein